MGNRMAAKELIKELENQDFARDYGAEMAKLEFAITLANNRIAKHLPQQELARQLGKSQPYIAKLEGGEANPTLETVGAILAAMGLRLVITTAPLVPEVKTERNHHTKENVSTALQREKKVPVLIL